MEPKETQSLSSISSESKGRSYSWAFSNVYEDPGSVSVRTNELWKTPMIKRSEPVKFYFYYDSSEPKEKCTFFVTLNHIQVPSTIEKIKAPYHKVTPGTFEVTVYPEESGDLRVFVKRGDSTNVSHSLKVEVEE
ncbi:MAG: hypothetical protein U9N35_00150 [Euryarchaeota archaeon]|nr:hypothetical protein [Euryarchaeota archaeon]